MLLLCWVGVGFDVVWEFGVVEFICCLFCVCCCVVFWIWMVVDLWGGLVEVGEGVGDECFDDGKVLFVVCVYEFDVCVLIEYVVCGYCFFVVYCEFDVGCGQFCCFVEWSVCGYGMVDQLQ